MIEIRATDVFNQWLDGLLDLRGRARIQARIERLAAGNAGDTKPVGEGISELRIDCGPGYRVYFKLHGRRSVILLAGGDKSTRGSDIKTASRLGKNSPPFLFLVRAVDSLACSPDKLPSNDLFRGAIQQQFEMVKDDAGFGRERGLQIAFVVRR